MFVEAGRTQTEGSDLCVYLCACIYWFLHVLLSLMFKCLHTPTASHLSTVTKHIPVVNDMAKSSSDVPCHSTRVAAGIQLIANALPPAGRAHDIQLNDTTTLRCKWATVNTFPCAAQWPLHRSMIEVLSCKWFSSGPGIPVWFQCLNSSVPGGRESF